MYKKVKRLSDMTFKDKRVIIRFDFNVPLDTNRQITSSKRIDAALPTLQHILSHEPKQVVLMSHMGKPKKLADTGKEFERQLSLDVVAEALTKKLGEEVHLVKDYLTSDLPTDKIVLLENVRFHYDKEQSKDQNERMEFAKRLASFGDLFVNDAFGSSHRKEASVYDIATLLPSCMGFLIEKELKAFSTLLEQPQKPFIAIIGGAKVKSKIGVLNALFSKVDQIIIIGAMEYAFEKAKGNEVGRSLSEGVDIAKELLLEHKDKLILPIDTIIAKKENDTFSDIQTVSTGNIPADYTGVDIGPQTIKQISTICSKAKTILWNGPAGIIEHEEFAKGTTALATILTDLEAFTVVGGGDSVAAIEKTNLSSHFDHVSTGGGASLELVEKGSLPALDILEQN